MNKDVYIVVYVTENIKAHYVMLVRVYIQGGPKMAHFWYALTSSNINRFSKLFRCQNQEKICNNIVTGGLVSDSIITNFLLILTVK